MKISIMCGIIFASIYLILAGILFYFTSVSPEVPEGLGPLDFNSAILNLPVVLIVWILQLVNIDITGLSYSHFLIFLFTINAIVYFIIGSLIGKIMDSVKNVLTGS